MKIVKLPFVILGKHPIVGFTTRLSNVKVFHFFGIHISGKTVIIGKYRIEFSKSRPNN